MFGPTGGAGTTGDAIGDLLCALERARYEGDLEALVLGDGEGLVVAGAGAVWLCEELAARAPFLDSEATPANDVVPNSLEALVQTRVVRLQVDGVELLICGRGGTTERGLLDAAKSARRLLAFQRRRVEVASPIKPESSEPWPPTPRT
jgi:hypothetical protein